MVNAWSLLYDELYGDGGMTKEKYDYDDKGPGVAFSTSTFPDRSDQDFWKEDGISLTGNPTACADTISFGDPAIVGSRVPGGMGEDHISLSGGFDNTAQDFPQYYSDIHGMVAGVDPFAPDLSHRKPAPNLKGTVSKKYQEDVGIKDLKDYVSSTYQGHYTNDSSDVQTLDLIHSVGDAESFCRSNALKYLSRYDKKGQAKRDILKAMHYCLLLYYFSGNTNNETSTHGYETF